MKHLLLIGLAVSSMTVVAQDATPDSVSNWTIGGVTSLTFNKVTLTNWASGGENSSAGTFLFNSHFNYKKDKVNWDNTIDLGYGLTKQGTKDNVKSEDRVYLVSKYGYAASKQWFYSGLVDFKTQLAPGYKDPSDPLLKKRISDFMAPAYTNVSLGMDYKPSKNFSAYISPVTAKFTFVSDSVLSNAGAFGVEPGDNMRKEFGASAKISGKKANVVKNVDISSRLDLFSNLQENPQNVDVDWEVVFNFKVNNLLSAIASFNMVYDDDVKYVNEAGVVGNARAQFKQLFGFGLSYKFGE